MPRLSLSFVALVAACSCGGATPTPPAPVASSELPAREGGYEVHEWGLVRATPGDVLSVSAIAPPAVIVPMAVDKPVLYFHASAPLTLRRVAVHVEGGCIREHWPLAPLTGDCRDVAWTDVAVDPTASCAPSPLPTDCGPTAPPGTFCEVPGLAAVRTTDAACVTVASGSEHFLFYRSDSRTFTPPLVFTPAADGTVRVANRGERAIPGRLVRIEATYGGVRALAVAAPAPGGELVVGTDFGSDGDTGDEDLELAGSPEPGRMAVREAFAALGLTDEEAAAFLRAWDEQLFAGMPGADVLSVDDMPVDTLTADEAVDMPAAPVTSFLYFLPAEDVDGLATLELDPPPTAVHRAMAIWARVGG